MKIYSVVTKKKIEFPKSKLKLKKKGSRWFAVGTYKANGKTYEAWRILGKKDLAKLR